MKLIDGLLDTLGISKKVLTFTMIGIIGLTGIITTFKCAYTVGDAEQAIVTTFGKVTDVKECGTGLTFKIPFIQKVNKIQTQKTYALEIGYQTDKNGDVLPVDSESKMITGDFNIVNIDFFAEYKISDPVKYVYNSYDATTILKDVIQGASRSIVGTKTVDDVLTTGKPQIEAEMKELIQKHLDLLDLGISIQDIKVQDSEPPTAEVQQAFKAVENAKQEKETMLNESYTYENEQIPLAESNADKIIKEAEAFKQNKIENAIGEVEKLNQMYSEYIQYPQVTKTRMYYETIQKILPDVKVVIDTSNSNNKLFTMDLNESTKSTK